jgi:serine/threonine protein phosphatase PrpC
MTIFSGREHSLGCSSPASWAFWKLCGQQLCACCRPTWHWFQADQTAAELVESEVITPTLSIAGLEADQVSLKGPHRPSNQDRCYGDCGLGIFVLADGMGGRRGGEEASQLVVDRLPRRVATVLANSALEPEMIKQALREAFEAAEFDMRRYAARHPECHSMGATLVVAVVVENRLYVARAGDCRGYLFRNQQLLQLTHDHNLAQPLLDAQLLTEAEAAKHPWRHRVFNGVGARPSHQPPEITEQKLEVGDRLLLTSDGLTSVVSNEQIARILQLRPTPREAVRRLASQALHNQSHDNLSCIVVDFLAHPAHVHPHAWGNPHSGSSAGRRRGTIAAPTIVSRQV